MTRPRRERKPVACLALAVALTALAGCGGDRGDEQGSDGAYRIAIERVAFAAEQRVAQPNTFVLSVRNSGDRALPDLVVTLRGFAGVAAGADLAAATSDRWLVDEPPAGTATAIDDTWAAGRLEPGATRTLRWRVTPVLAGRHELSYAIAAGAAGGRVRLAEDRPARGRLTVRVTSKPAFARVDPRTGRVIRRE